MAAYPITLGIDPGLSTTGIVAFCANRKCVHVESISTPKTMTDDRRNIEIVARVLATIHRFDVAARPTMAAVEQYVFQGKNRANSNAVFRLSRLVGCIESALRGEGLTVVGYTRGQGLQAIGLPNNASKRAAKLTIQRLTKSRGGICPTNEHTCAAWAMAWAATGVRRP